jgi:hypothetical protein
MSGSIHEVANFSTALRPGIVTVLACALCGCGWNEWFRPKEKSLPNEEAIERGLKLCALTQGERPFHLILEIAPPPNTSGEVRAQVEIFWLNPITYRTVIHSRSFNQIRIVNGNVVEEHDTGDFYPRWIQNFVDAIFEPVPKSATLRKIPGKIPIGRESHACISNSAHPELDDDVSSAQVCFEDSDPKIASGREFGRYVSFDDFAPFGAQQIARTLVDDLPTNVLVSGRITRLEPLANSDYGLLKAMEFTPADKQIRTALASKSDAIARLDSTPVRPNYRSNHRTYRTVSSHATGLARAPATDPAIPPLTGPATVYVRTDRSGKVREAYRDGLGHFTLDDPAILRALSLKFKPLLVNGVPQQMEAQIELP